MTHYSWTIQTAEDAGVADLRPVYLSLHGLRATTEEMMLPTQAYGPGSILSGVLRVEGELGELQTGTLRTAESTAAPWAVAWMRVVNLRNGRQWTARGGVCDASGSCPMLRFVRTRGALGFPRVYEDPGSEESANGFPDNRAPSCTPDLVRTYEIFGTHRGRTVPLKQILQMRAGVKTVRPGGRIWIATDAMQGFGLAGMPGKWEDFYPGVSPEAYGLDPDKPVLASDGVSGWVLDAHYLAMLFGAEWRRVVYGN